MTREEYERLLQSDYWKGYSYSLIKERNFTCEDCGRSFPNERNKLQVHHLVYRDANPWSYDPDELVVLCEECHKRRHGILPETEPVRESKTAETDNYTRSYSSDYNTSERKVGHRNTNWEPDFYPKRRRAWKKYLAVAGILAAILYFGIPSWKMSEEGKQYTTPTNRVADQNQEESPKTSPVVVKKQTKKAGDALVPPVPVQEPVVLNELVEVPVMEIAGDVVAKGSVSQTQSSPAEPVEQQSTTETHNGGDYRESILRQAKQAGVSTEGTTAEILDRIYHANIIKMAKQAGVSTEGTTAEILDRINHASVVKQAQYAGVSAEGTTAEILDRINHASAVKQAQLAGVSTEGTTAEILDRINHASAVKQAQLAGVSTEGTTAEILDRIIHAAVVKQAERAGVSTEGSTPEILD